MHRYFVTGTDTDVGKTRVAGSLALALRRSGETPTVVKLVQTGVLPGVAGDAARAGKLAGTRHLELARFEKAADPWSAAVASGKHEVRAYELVDALAAVPGSLVAEGAGGIMVPLNPAEHFGHVAARANLRAVVVVGLRLGCLNHALLTLNLCEQLRIGVAGGVLVERWEPVETAYRNDVLRTLQGKLRIFGILPFDPDEAASVQTGASLFEDLVCQ
ncbi:MAG TPA: dethiobiotin synthase [Candidatus Baltobacteraceae bacterium]|nr:dethiobiotin synthase [Candidatus Baltobacteraceae bacterium]